MWLCKCPSIYSRWSVHRDVRIVWICIFQQLLHDFAWHLHICMTPPDFPFLQRRITGTCVLPKIGRCHGSEYWVPHRVTWPKSKPLLNFTKAFRMGICSPCALTQRSVGTLSPHLLLVALRLLPLPISVSWSWTLHVVGRTWAPVVWLDVNCWEFFIRKSPYLIPQKLAESSCAPCGYESIRRLYRELTGNSMQPLTDVYSSVRYMLLRAGASSSVTIGS